MRQLVLRWCSCAWILAHAAASAGDGGKVTAALSLAGAVHADALDAQSPATRRQIELSIPARSTAEVRLVIRAGSGLGVEVWGDGFSDFDVELRDTAGRLIDRDPDGSDKGLVSAKPAGVERAVVVSVRNLGERSSVMPVFLEGAIRSVTLLRGGHIREIPEGPSMGNIPGASGGPTGSVPLPAPTPTPITSTPGEIDALHKFALRLIDGVVGFDYAPRMRVGDETRVRLRVSVTKAIQDLRAELAAPGRVQILEPVKVSQVMRADLVGPGFDIVRIGTAEQLVDAGSDTEWSWDVVAKSAGRLRLTVTLTAVVRIEGTDRARDVRSFHRDVEVEATARSTWQTLVRTVESYGPPAELAWPSIATGVGAVWLWIMRRKRHRRKSRRRDD